MVHHEEVATVEEGVTLDQDVPQDLLLGLNGVSSVAVERGPLGDLGDKQPCLTYREDKEGQKLGQKLPEG